MVAIQNLKRREDACALQSFAKKTRVLGDFARSGLECDTSSHRFHRLNGTVRSKNKIDYPLIDLSRVSFQSSHRCVIRLSRFGMLRVRQLDPPNIAELRRPSCARKQDRSRPAGFYSEAESGRPRLRHRV